MTRGSLLVEQHIAVTNTNYFCLPSERLST